MPRDSSGNYSLPSTVNPVLTGTTITSTWANTTLNDLATEMTDSLDRSGKGPMLSALKVVDGTVGSPGLTWGTEPTSGLYRVSAGHLGVSIGGTKLLDLSSTTLGITGIETIAASADGIIFSASRTGGANNPSLAVSLTDAGSLINLIPSGTAPVIQILTSTGNVGLRLAGASYVIGNSTDKSPISTNGNLTIGGVAASQALVVNSGNAAAAQTADLIVNRAGSVANAAELEGPNITLWDTTNTTVTVMQQSGGQTEFWQFAGSWVQVARILSSSIFQVVDDANTQQNVGYRGLPQNVQIVNYTTVLADRGKQLNHGSASAHTFTIAANASVAYQLGDVLHFVNPSGGGVLTISINSDTLVFAPSGATGSRTLTAPGIATAEKIGTTTWMITGVNIT